MLLNKPLKYSYYLLISFLIICCGNNSENEFIVEEEIVEESVSKNIKILALGDSYTIGESVCEKCKFPEQLLDSLNQRNENIEFDLKIIARTGWTTSNLINAMDNENLTSNFDLVTLLIGVNNQYQGIPFSTFQKELPILIDKTNKTVNYDKSKVIVLSIPDYAFTPFGNGRATISMEIEKYNSYIKNYCQNNAITFLNITDITQAGLTNPIYVANDGLHPSEDAYTEFVKRLLPIVLQKLDI